MSSRRRAAFEAVAAAQAGPLHIILLMPDLSITVQEGDSEVPGVRDAEIDMPPGSSAGRTVAPIQIWHISQATSVAIQVGAL